MELTGDKCARSDDIHSTRKEVFIVIGVVVVFVVVLVSEDAKTNAIKKIILGARFKKEKTNNPLLLRYRRSDTTATLVHSETNVVNDFM